MSIARHLGIGLAVASGCLALPEATLAAEPGWYYGLNGGKSNADLDKADLDGLADFVISTAGPPLTSTSSLADSKTSWSLFFGYQFSRYLAFEAGYLELGSFPYRYQGTADLSASGGGVAPTSFDYAFDFKGYPLSVIGILPLGPVFNLHARVGLFMADSKVKFSAAAGAAQIGFTDSANSQDLFYGAGVGMDLGDTWSLSLDWAKYDKVGDGDVIAETDLDALSLSLMYRFGLF